MSRSAINFLLDMVLLLSFLSAVCTAAIVKFVFPPPTKSAGWSLWNMDYDGWANLHCILLGLFAFVVLLHVIMHWTWVCGFVAGKLSKGRGVPVRIDSGIGTIYGVALLIGVLMVLGGILTVAAVTVTEGPNAGADMAAG